MASVLDLIQQVLCYGELTRSSCMQEFQQYAYQPMEGIFYNIFFPIVFIIIFIYIISGTVGAFTRGIRILVAMAVLAFIIFQGYYYLVSCGYVVALGVVNTWQQVIRDEALPFKFICPARKPQIIIIIFPDCDRCT